jgi:deazaflavin-dependent oxidoreductase (nitroreductase family)
MTTDTLPQRRGILRLTSVLNPLIARLLRLGAPMGPNVLLTVRGRTSGQPRTFPIAVLEHDGHRYVFSPFGEVNWVRNLRAAGAATIKRGRREEPVVATELRPEDAGPILQAALAPLLASRLTRQMLGRFYDLTRESSPADYLAEARSHPGFELRAAQ